MNADPFNEFEIWFRQAQENEPSDPDAVALASVNAQGQPSIRMVLMRSVDATGFVFYTNLESRKAHDFATNPRAAMCFHWKSTARQIRIEGAVEQVDDDIANVYFSSRPIESQVGAWASKQSASLESRELLERRFRDFSEKFAGAEIPRPDFWSGYRLVPESFEFWDKRPFRLHERTIYKRQAEHWTQDKLFP
ncbi:MAG: pyridoxamine 5'-phosphate oxidase [Proteobacteria bacterium]|nr:pyridoxamine 5'-phosphate oxidase [Pseudomonadota bacterium]